jgi:hypothetical protein
MLHMFIASPTALARLSLTSAFIALCEAMPRKRIQRKTGTMP